MALQTALSRLMIPTWVVTLKDGIKFSNGKTFDAAAAKQLSNIL